MADRAGPARWLLLSGGREQVAAVLLAGVFLLLLGLGRLGVIAVAEPAAVRGMAGGMIPGLFAFLSIVIAINQLVLTQEFGSADELRDRLRELRAFRREVEATTHRSPSPVVPTAFLATVVRAVADAATRVEESLPADADPELRREVEGFADELAADAGSAAEALRGSDSGRINAILPVLEYPDAEQLHRARELRERHADDLPAETDRALAELEETLGLFGVARTHFRTNYTQRVLARLSRRLVYVGVAALVAAVVLTLFAGPPGSVLDRYRLVTVSALATVALAPVAVLAAYVLRIATVSERTIAVGPFESRPGDGEDWRSDE